MGFPGSRDSIGGVLNNTGISNVPKVTGLHPKVVDQLSLLLTEAKARKLNVAVHMGVRTPEQQDALYALGRTKPGSIVTNAPSWSSWHCYGLSIDLVFKDEKGNWTWSDSCDWYGLGETGKIFGFTWGGDFSRFPDFPHFQMTGKIPSVKKAKEILFNEGIDSLWKFV